MRGPVPPETIALALREARAVSGGAGRRPEAIALAAILVAYPRCCLGRVAAAMGMPQTSARRCVDQHRASPSWNEVHVDHVVGALVAPQYGARAV